MGTRSVVGVREIGSEKITAAYVHYDGYLSGVGLHLMDDFNSAASARRVVAGGYYSSLSSDLDASRKASANSEEPMVWENYEEFREDLVHSDWEFAYIYDVDLDEWTYASITDWGTSESGGFSNSWSEFDVLVDDVLKDVLENADRLSGSSYEGRYDDYVAELRDWATNYVVDAAVN
jgi:hypothetical protein